MFDKLYDKIIIPNKINIKYDKIINIFNLIIGGSSLCLFNAS